MLARAVRYGRRLLLQKVSGSIPVHPNPWGISSIEESGVQAGKWRTTLQSYNISSKGKKKSKSDGSEESGEEILSEKEAALQAALNQIASSFGKETVMWLGRFSGPRNVPVISTGSVGLDVALGVGGLPRGRVIEIYGPEASGKTTLALHAIAEAQKNGGYCVFIDAEHALDPSLAEALGVKTENLLLAQPDCGEQALSLVDTFIRSGSIDVVVVDSDHFSYFLKINCNSLRLLGLGERSLCFRDYFHENSVFTVHSPANSVVAALVPRSELDGEMGDAHIAVQARLMSQALRKLSHSLSRSQTLLIFINQVRARLSTFGGFGGPTEVTSGGNALKFYASVRLNIRRTGLLKKGEETIGSQVVVKVAKNKLAPPFKTAEFELEFGKGISCEAEVLDLGCKHGFVSKSGSYYSVNEEHIHGKENAKKYLREHQGIRDELIRKLKEKLLGCSRENSINLPPEDMYSSEDKTLSETNSDEMEVTGVAEG